MENFKELLSDMSNEWGLQVLYALVLLVVGHFAIKIILGVISKLMAKSKVDEILVAFVRSILKFLLYLFLWVAVLDMFGVNTSSFIALIGAAGLAVGLALKDSLQNFAAGVMLVLFRPFKAGDFIEASGVAGVVEKISIFSTILRTGDNREILIPNGSIYGGNIINYSARETRRIDLVFGIGYGDDIKLAKQIMLDFMAADERILKDPEPVVAVSELGDSSVNFVVRPWVNSSDYWAVRFDLLEGIKIKFDENNISIPYPQMDVHVDKV